jgi:hypothetical protein
VIKAAGERAEFVRDEIEPLYRSGLSLRAIASALNDAGILTPNRKSWGAQGVANVIDRLGLAAN